MGIISTTDALHIAIHIEMPSVSVFSFTIQLTVVALTTENADEYSSHMTPVGCDLKCELNGDKYPASFCHQIDAVAKFCVSQVNTMFSLAQ